MFTTTLPISTIRENLKRRFDIDLTQKVDSLVDLTISRADGQMGSLTVPMNGFITAKHFHEFINHMFVTYGDKKESPAELKITNVTSKLGSHSLLGKSLTCGYYSLYNLSDAMFDYLNLSNEDRRVVDLIVLHNAELTVNEAVKNISENNYVILKTRQEVSDWFEEAIIQAHDDLPPYAHINEDEFIEDFLSYRTHYRVRDFLVIDEYS